MTHKIQKEWELVSEVSKWKKQSSNRVEKEKVSTRLCKQAAEESQIYTFLTTVENKTFIYAFPETYKEKKR